MLLVLSFPPFNLYPLAWVSLVPLLVAIADRGTKNIFFPGLVTGAVYFLGTVYWVFHSMYVYGHIPAVASLCLLFLLCFYLSLYTGIFAVLFNVIYVRLRLPAMFIAPVMWTTLEYARTYILTGFPWSLLGYSQYSFLPLIQISDITGVYGISFLVTAVNGLIFDLIRHERTGESTWALNRHVKSGAILLAFVMIAVMGYGAAELRHIDHNEKIKVSVLQGNIDQDKKWDRDHQREVIDLLWLQQQKNLIWLYGPSQRCLFYSAMMRSLPMKSQTSKSRLTLICLSEACLLREVIRASPCCQTVLSCCLPGLMLLRCMTRSILSLLGSMFPWAIFFLL